MAPKRKTLSFEEKGVILDKLNRGMRVIAVANEYGVNESTIRTIRKNREKIRAALQAGNAASSKSLRSASNIVLARTEKILLKSSPSSSSWTLFLPPNTTSIVQPLDQALLPTLS